jgi:hypothetical protein
MCLRNLAPRTQEAYIRGCKRLAVFLRRSPDTATAEDIRQIQLHLAEQGVSICTATEAADAKNYLVGSARTNSRLTQTGRPFAGAARGGPMPGSDIHDLRATALVFGRDAQTGV